MIKLWDSRFINKREIVILWCCIFIFS